MNAPISVTIEALEKQGSILEIQDGNHGNSHPKASEYTKNGIAFVMASDIRDGSLDLQGCKHLPQHRTDRLRIGFAKEGDVLLTHKGTVGEVALVPKVSPYVMLTPQVTYYRTNPEFLLPRYLLYAFQAPGFQQQIASESAQSTRPYIGIQAQRRLRVFMRPVREQRRIASVLTAYDDLIKNNTRRIAILEEMARRLYEEWFVHFRFPGHEHGDPQEETPSRLVRSTVKMAYGGLYDGPHATPPECDDGPVFLGIKNVREDGGLDLSTTRHISEADFPRWTKRVTPAEGDIVFSYEATLNRYALVPRGFRGCLGRRLALVRPKPEYRLFLYLHFFSDDWRRVIAENTLSGATVDRIPLGKFPEFPIPLPQESVAAAFEERLAPTFKLIENLAIKNTNLRSQRDLLLPKLVSGEIDVSEVEETVAEAAA